MSTLYVSDPASNGGLGEQPALNYVETIETVISSLDQFDSALVSQTDSEHLWTFKYGSVDVFVQLTGFNSEDTLTIWAPVLTLPVQNEAALLRKLMEMNWLTTLEARFSIFNQQIVVVASRTLEGLTTSEISRGITIVATLADEYDDSLRVEFSPAVQ
uniref:YbjN domain-containing protein n=1 Tax=Cyanothece sp. (strain PCC 7425 / ATCC 29141) TaxID=395961 RepID=B8HLH8_CYAP4